MMYISVILLVQPLVQCRGDLLHRYATILADNYSVVCEVSTSCQPLKLTQWVGNGVRVVLTRLNGSCICSPHVCDRIWENQLVSNKIIAFLPFESSEDAIVQI